MSWFRGSPATKKDIQKFQDIEDKDETLYQMVLCTRVQVVCVNHPGRLIALLSSMESMIISETHNSSVSNDKEKNGNVS